jgi:hypothetical protein
MARWVVGILALWLVQAANAEVPAQQKTDGNIPLGLSQRQAFARSLIEDAAVTARIQASQDAEAQSLLAAAQDSYQKALAALTDGDFNRAEKFFGDAIVGVGKARRRVPDNAALLAKQHADYQKLLDGVEAMQKSYLSYLKRTKLPAEAEAEAGDRANQEVVKQLDAAKKQADEKHLAEASQTLGKAEQVIKLALGRVLGLTVVNVPEKFASQPEAYSFETERNHNFLDLIVVALDELRPTEDTKQTIESLVEQSRAATDLAERYIELQDYDKALFNIRAANVYLRSALTTAGVVIPRGRGGE